MNTLEFAGVVLAVVLVGALAAPSSRADEGEVFIAVHLSPEAAWLLHPEVHEPLASPLSPTGSFTFLPRAGAAVSYGLFNQLSLGAGVDGAAIPNLKATGVVLAGTSGDLLTGTYAELTVPLSLTWRFDSGYDVSGSASLAAGPLVSVWSGNALGDPKRPDASGLPSRLPLDIADTWSVGAVLRGSVALEARFFDVFVIALEPFAALSFSGTLGVHAGLAVRPSVALGPL